MASANSATPNASPCRLVVEGVVANLRPWATKDNPPQQKLSFDVVFLGGRYGVTTTPSHPVFSKLGNGEPVSLAIPFVEHPKFGWKGQGEPLLLNRATA
jgi:hypothetical protein